MMTLRRFRTLADSYGADLQRWPQRLRGRALALLDSSVEAQAVISRAKELDDIIAAARAARLERLWGGESADAALHRLQKNVSERIRRPPSGGVTALHGMRPRAAGHYRPRPAEWIGLVTAASLAVIAGLALGILSSPSAPQEDLTALLQPAPLQVLTDSP
ncbi:MAG TPA: hypothetical protein VFX20_17725 [Steroidobacteraceae bacterium]|nr:hypothetical protein [Steroidobacteraceae bacterium]